ncbi:ribosome small subunit-dependent GTPase A [Mycoplasmatota bacterium]|nr:ribosome small subunit-dependent GTPase A [Mycoplasmatota bacterium]
MPKGLIIKALSGFYYVEEALSKKVYECRGRGVFRNKNITPLVGDNVNFQIEANNQGYVNEIEERKNFLVRPAITNVDQVLLVFSVKSPEFNQPLLDRFLAVIESSFIKPVIILSKMDLITESEIDPFINYYESIGYTIVKTSKYDKESIEKVCNLLENKISVLAGQSGVGKSSLLNAINPQFKLNTDEISKALGRGKHTTRHVELFKVGNGLVADTPGFSSLDFRDLEIDAELLAQSFVDFFELSSDCKFRGCLHIHEPKCAVKAKLEENSVYDNRYLNYKNFHEEIKNQRVIYQKKQ